MKKILILIDVQNDFITGSLANEEAQKKVPNIVKKIREFKGDAIMVTRDTHAENYLETREGKNLPVVHCVEGTEGWSIEPNVQAALNDAALRNIDVEYIDKPTFGSYDLVGEIGNILDITDYDDEGEFNLEDSQIELIGFCTDICVVSNAILLKASLFENCDLSVDASCCAGVTPESHTAALTTMKMCQITVTNE